MKLIGRPRAEAGRGRCASRFDQPRDRPWSRALLIGSFQIHIIITKNYHNSMIFVLVRNDQFFFTEPRQTWINRKRINTRFGFSTDCLSADLKKILVSGLLFCSTKIYWFLLLIIVDSFFSSFLSRLFFSGASSVCRTYLLNKNNNLKIVLNSPRAMNGHWIGWARWREKR